MCGGWCVCVVFVFCLCYYYIIACCCTALCWMLHDTNSNHNNSRFLIFSSLCAFSLFVLNAGAFLVPYMIMVFLLGIPIFFAELFVGQYSGFGAIKAYARLAPFFSGKYQKDWLHIWSVYHQSSTIISMYVHGARCTCAWDGSRLYLIMVYVRDSTTPVCLQHV